MIKIFTNYSNKPTDPIGVFDSGVGGLSVLREVRKLLPYENIIYVADSKYAPYGDKSAQYVQYRSQQIAYFLLKKRIKTLVVACNTATAEAVDQLRAQLSIPIIGLEPAIKPGVKMSKTGVIGVLATQRTIDSERLYALTIRYAPHTKVIAQACSGLVEKVEANHLDRYETRMLIKKYTAPLLQQNVDTIILGCTHYPFLHNTIRLIIGNDIQLVETGVPVARHLQCVLKQHDLLNTANIIGQIDFYNSSHLSRHKKAMKQLWDESISILPLPVFE
jgi:glutamate racemase